MKIDIRKKHLTKYSLIKKLCSSYIVAFILIASFSLILLGSYQNVAEGKKLFTTEDSSEDSDTVSVTPASSVANENSIVSTTETTTDSTEDTDTEKVNPSSIVANENSIVSTTETTTDSDDDSIENDEDDSDFWNWLTNYDEDEDDQNEGEPEYYYEPNENSDSIEETLNIQQNEFGFISKLKQKLINNNLFLPTNYLLLRFEKYIK